MNIIKRNKKEETCDYVNIIKCKDCKYSAYSRLKFTKTEYLCCLYENLREVKKNDFCNNGKLRER